MQRLPPLECLRFFEAAARHESFAKAADELCVTPAAVAHRIKRLEKHLDDKLFVRHHRGVRLNQQGREYLEEIQRILFDIHDVTERQRRNRSSARRLKIISIEVLAEKWLMPKLADFRAIHPDIAIEFLTDYREIDLAQRDIDVWLAYANEVKDTLYAEPLFEEVLFPVCSPVLLEERGRPERPSDLHVWPLLYDLIWASDWSYWFAHQGEQSPNLSQASGFRLYSMVVQAAVEGMGVAIGHSSMITQELEREALVSLFDSQIAAPARYLLVTTPASACKREVQAFRDWVLRQA